MKAKIIQHRAKGYNSPRILVVERKQFRCQMIYYSYPMPSKIKIRVTKSYIDWHNKRNDIIEGRLKTKLK